MSESSKSKTVLGPDCRISGELALDNDAVIMGQFKGTLRVSGTLELTDSAVVSGTVIAGNLRLAGRVEADVVAEEGVELLPGAELVGQLFTSRLNVIEGAVFQGDVCVGPNAMQAAGEALGAESLARPAAVDTDYDEADYDEQPAEAPEAAPQQAQARESSVKTNPGSVNAILQRRRPKVLHARREMSHNGNGNGIGQH